MVEISSIDKLNMEMTFDELAGLYIEDDDPRPGMVLGPSNCSILSDRARINVTSRVGTMCTSSTECNGTNLHHLPQLYHTLSPIRRHTSLLVYKPWVPHISHGGHTSHGVYKSWDPIQAMGSKEIMVEQGANFTLVAMAYH
jgi:hypothetical protein